MSLLDRPNADVIVYPEEVTTDGDGNTLTRPSQTGVPAKARIHPLGTPTEVQDVGFRTTSKYRMLLVGWTGDVLGAQAQIDWDGKRWAVDGDGSRYNGSPRTAHVTYTIKRY